MNSIEDFNLKMLKLKCFDSIKELTKNRYSFYTENDLKEDLVLVEKLYNFLIQESK